MGNLSRFFSKRRGWRWYLRFLAKIITLAILLGLISILVIQHSVVQKARGKTYNDVQRISGKHVGLVFGCDDRFQGRENLYFTYRMDAAAELWHAGKLECLIVSGDNSSPYYNEPRKMRKALIDRGVPAEQIVCDYAGLRTLDSVLRARSTHAARDSLRYAWIAKRNGFTVISSLLFFCLAMESCASS
jgi:SanA protein